MIPSSCSPVVPDIDPRPILDMNYAFARTAMLVAAVRLHIFTFLSDRELTPAALAAIAQRCGRSIPLIIAKKAGGKS
ncbi:MAG: hypothetical protein ACJ797_10450 [Ktedonobacteraceae bacterium]|jgi:hypothetical protein